MAGTACAKAQNCTTYSGMALALQFPSCREDMWGGDGEGGKKWEKIGTWGPYCTGPGVLNLGV